MNKCHENFGESLVKRDKTNYFRVIVPPDLNG